MTIYAAATHQDNGGIRTTSEYGDRGDGTDAWLHRVVAADGADATQGAIGDTAETDPTNDATVVQLLKGLLTAMRLSAAGLLKAEDAASASGDSGVFFLGVRNDTRASLVGADGDYSGVAVGSGGNIFTSPVPSSQSAWALSRAANTAAAASLIIKASAGKLFRVSIQNGATAQFFQIHNTASVPADTAVPIRVIRLAANEYREIDLGPFGDYFSTGITVCNSSTLATKTIGAADSWVTALYL